MKVSLSRAKCSHCGCQDFEIIRVGRFVSKVKCLNKNCSNKKPDKTRVVHNFILKEEGVLKD